MRLTLCEVTIAGSRELADPYDAVPPYITCESALLLVVHATVAPDVVIDEVVIPVIVRGPPASESVKGLDEPFSVAVIVAV